MLLIFTGTQGITCLPGSFEMLNTQAHYMSQEEEGSVCCLFSHVLGNEGGSCLHSLAFNSDLSMQNFPLSLLTVTSSSARINGLF